MERWLRGPLLHFLLFGIVLFASYAYMHRGRSEVESSRQIALTLDDLRTTAVIYVFATVTTTKAVIFLIWCIIVGLMDNILKPILLGREPPFQLGSSSWAQSVDSWRWPSSACLSAPSFSPWDTR